LTNTGTSERHAAETAADGGYRFVNLVPGNYSMAAEKASAVQANNPQQR